MALTSVRPAFQGGYLDPTAPNFLQSRSRDFMSAALATPVPQSPTQPSSFVFIRVIRGKYSAFFWCLSHPSWSFLRSISWSFEPATLSPPNFFQNLPFSSSQMDQRCPFLFLHSGRRSQFPNFEL